MMKAVDFKRYPVLPLPQGPFTVGWIGTPTLAILGPLPSRCATCKQNGERDCVCSAATQAFDFVPLVGGP
jgi:hypothetical protein